MHTSVLITFAAALAVAVALPGPGIVSVVSCTLAHGFRYGLGLISGIVVGDLLYFTLAVLGMAAIARSMGAFFLVVKLAGGAYLIWLGVKLWRQPPRPIDSGPVPSGDRPPRSFLAGLLVTVSNPKAIGFYAGLLPTFVDLPKLTGAEVAVMAATVAGVVFTIPLLYAAAAERSRRLLRDSRRVRIMNRTAGTVLIGSGIAVATR